MISYSVEIIMKNLMVRIKKNITNSIIFKRYFLMNYPNIKMINDVVKSNDIIMGLLADSKPHLICRMGWGGEPTPLLWQIRKERFPFIKYPEYLKKTLKVNTGMFSTNFLGRHYYLKKYTKSLKKCDCIGLWDYDEYIDDKIMIQKFVNQKRCVLLSAKAFDCLGCLNINKPYYMALNGKKVLIINPNAKLIESQYKIKEKILPKDKELPSFILKTYAPINTQGSAQTNKYSTWKECLKKMVEEIKLIDFDIALVSCGSYGIPICAEIFKLGKTAVYVGGALQMFFGILGKRWENNITYKKYINEYWKRPLPDEKPDGYKMVEGGCYW